MSIAENAVATHLDHVLATLRAEDPTQAVAMVLHWGVLDVPADAPEDLQQRWKRLSGRERVVLTLLAEANTPEEIAAQLRSTAGTVGRHVRNSMNKLDAHTRARAVVLAYQGGKVAVLDVRLQYLEKREVQVMRLAAELLTDEEIAYQLNLAVADVETYRRGAATKLNAHTLAHLVALAHGFDLVHRRKAAEDARRPVQLSSSERVVIALLAHGHTDQDLATWFGASLFAVQRVIYAIMIEFRMALRLPTDAHLMPPVDELGAREYAHLVARAYELLPNPARWLTVYDIADAMETDPRLVSARIGKIAIETAGDRAALPRDEWVGLLGYEKLLRLGLTHRGAAVLAAEELTFQGLAVYGRSPEPWSIADVEALVSRARARLAGSLPTMPDELATAAVVFAQRFNPDALRHAYLRLSPVHAYYAWLRFTGGLSHDAIAAEFETAAADLSSPNRWSIFTPIATSSIGPQSRFATTDWSALEKTVTALTAEFLLDSGWLSRGVDIEAALVAMTSGWHLKDLAAAIAILPPRLQGYANDRYLQGMMREHIAQERGWNVDDIQRRADDALVELTRPAPAPLPRRRTCSWMRLWCRRG